MRDSSPLPAPGSPGSARRPGFTLIEMLVVVLLLSLLVGLVFYLVNTTNGTARTGLARSSIYAGAREARALLANDFNACIGPILTPVTTPYPDRDPTTLDPDVDPATGARTAGSGVAMDKGPQRGCLIVVPGCRQGRLPALDGSPGKVVNLRCDQLFFLADTRRGGAAPNPLTQRVFRSLLQTTQTSPYAAVWIGPVSPSDEVVDPDGVSEAQTWCLGRQAILLKDPTQDTPANPGASFTGTGLNPAAAWTSDMARFPLKDYVNASGTLVKGVSHWMMDLSAAPGIPPGASDATLLGAFTIAANGGSTALFTKTGAANAFPWPVINPNPETRDTLTPADDPVGGLTNTSRLLLRHCSECIIQVCMDNNGNGVPDTDNKRDGVLDDGSHPGDINVAPWGDGVTSGATLPRRDLSGDFTWIPSDRDFNADKTYAAADGEWIKGTKARAPRVFWPQDAQPRIVHYGYYQGPDAAKYWTNGRGDVTPYPPIKQYPIFEGPNSDTNPATTAGGVVNGPINFGDAVVYGEYVNCDWVATTAYPVGAVVKSPAGSANFYIATAAGTGGSAPSAGAAPGPGQPTWASLPPGDPRRASNTDYASACANYAALHGWNPTAQRVAGAASPLYGKPPPAQSSWPTLIRIRVRLHDRAGTVKSYMGDFLTNGRDNDGDGTVNNPEEARASGIWFEYVFPLPYPRMQTSTMISPPGSAP